MNLRAHRRTRPSAGAVLATLGLTLALCAEARAACTKDTDCKGDRICRAGTCVFPDAPGPGTTAPPATQPPPLPPAAQPPPLPPATQPPPLPPAQPRPAPVVVRPPPVQVNLQESGHTPGDAGWAYSAGILGLVVTAINVGVTIAGEVLLDNRSLEDGGSWPARPSYDTLPSMVMASTNGVTTAIFAPIINRGGVSARRASGVKGVKLFRALGWPTFGLSLAAWTALAIFTPAAEDELPHGLYTAAGLLSAGSLALFTADALICYKEAKAQLKGGGEKKKSTRAPGEASALQLAPLVTTTRLADGGKAGLFGLSGTF